MQSNWCAACFSFEFHGPWQQGKRKRKTAFRQTRAGQREVLSRKCEFAGLNVDQTAIGTFEISRLRSVINMER
ncbi:hypothetical protein D3C80_2106750 [compost metagenome]